MITRMKLRTRVNNLEQMMAALTAQVDRTTRAVEYLSSEMVKFKAEMAEFKNEMKEFKNEMSEFKNEMSEFKNRQEEENKRKNKEWSNLAKKMGTIVEDLIAPALRPTLKKYFNCELTLEGQRMRRRIKGDEYEIDAIAMCEDKVFMIEVKSTPRQNDIEDILEKAEKFFEFFPEYAPRQLIKVFGGISFDDSVIMQASKHGIYVLGWREWEYMDILNFDAVASQKITV
ncbi:MAG: hypothetical protein N2738_03420 [Thermodesulfovibrionales bacterium]|nr:hypothetical protein [Thermodesulfovibrionales bacterium]